MKTCRASSDSSATGADRRSYCINGGTVSGSAEDCTCTSCNAGYQGLSCQNVIICEVNQHVVSNACISCPAGMTNTDGGDDASGDTTECDDVICGVNDYISGNECNTCLTGTTNANGGDNTSGDDTTCDKTLCAVNERGNKRVRRV